MECGFPHLMLREIHEQPEAVRLTLEREKDTIQSIVDALHKRPPDFVVMAARGTSDNAGTYARYIFGVVNGVVVARAAPSLLTIYKSSMRIEGSMVLGISQSGKATDVIEVLQRAREMKALTVALTNTADSPICSAAEHVVLTHAREEQAVAATKTFMTALAAIGQLSAMWADREDLISSLWEMPGLLEQVLQLNDWIAKASERYRYMDSCAILARGLDSATAQEIALKLAETCYISPVAFSAADFMHGPIAALEIGRPILLLAPESPSLPALLEVAEAVRKRQAELIVISNNEEALAMADLPIQIPTLERWEWSPMLTTVAGQLFTYHLAIHKKLNPDTPRGLTKVTLTF